MVFRYLCLCQETENNKMEELLPSNQENSCLLNEVEERLMIVRGTGSLRSAGLNHENQGL